MISSASKLNINWDILRCFFRENEFKSKGEQLNNNVDLTKFQNYYPYLDISASSGNNPGATIANGDLKNPSKIRPPDILRTYWKVHLCCTDVRLLFRLTSLQLIFGLFPTRDKQSVRFWIFLRSLNNLLKKWCRCTKMLGYKLLIRLDVTPAFREEVG